MLVAILGTMPDSHWLPAQAWVDDLHRLTNYNQAALEAYPLVLAGGGLVELGVADDQLLIRATKALRALLEGSEPTLPEAEEQFIVQPTFEVLASKTLPPSVLYRLERLTENRRADRVLQYKVTSASLRTAVENGEPPADIEAFFLRHARPPLAQNVRFSIREWTAGAARASFASVMLLRLSDPTVAERVRADKSLREWVVGQLTPTDLIVRPDAVEKVRKRLGTLGLVTEPGVKALGSGSAAGAVFKDDPEMEHAPITPTEFAQRWGPVKKRRTKGH